jgi:hypothetical protein
MSKSLTITTDNDATGYLYSTIASAIARGCNDLAKRDGVAVPDGAFVVGWPREIADALAMNMIVVLVAVARLGGVEEADGILTKLADAVHGDKLGPELLQYVEAYLKTDDSQLH